VTIRQDVRLVPLEPGHGERMLKWMRDPEVSENLGLRSEPSAERTADWIRSAAESDDVAPFAILRGDEHVGNVVLDRIDRYLGTARLSVYVGEAGARGSGVGRAGVYRALEYAFGSLGMHKVWLTVHAENRRAVASYAALGFQQEGLLRGEFFIGERRVDAYYMGLLRPEWESLRDRVEAP
jgi:RimJ/RimL family protein N-acetyltransferase